MKISTAIRNALANYVADGFDGGATPGKIAFYTATQPASPNNAISGPTLLATLTYSTTAYGDAANGVVTANTIASANAVATGTVAWCRHYHGNDTHTEANSTRHRIDATVGTSGADINFNTTSWQSGGTVEITSLTITMPEGS